MDFSKIRLANERNEHVTKRLNRLNAWKFFRVLYRDNIWRLFGFSILMILCMMPIFAMVLLGSFQLSGVEQTLPTLNGMGFSTGIWSGVADYYNQRAMQNKIQTGWFAVLASLLVTIIFSGGFAVMRDAFWTGKLSTVGVFKSIGKGIKANILYAFFTTVIISLSVFGIYVFCLWSLTALPLWATIIIAILLAIVAMFVSIYLLILCSVSVTYKQSLYENLDDSWRLMWLNILPNILHFLIAIIPIALYFVFQGNMLQMIYLTLVLMFGGMYFPLVWQTHMMKTFALFHPVEVKKKKSNQQAAQQQVVAEVSESEPAPEEEQAPKKKSKKKSKANEAEAEQAEAGESVNNEISQTEDDAYALPDSAYEEK